MNITLGFGANSRVLIVLFPTNKMLAVTKIVIKKQCDKVLQRSHMLTVLSPLNCLIIVYECAAISSADHSVCDVALLIYVIQSI